MHSEGTTLVTVHFEDSPFAEHSLTAVEQITREHPLTTTLKILGMQSSMKQHSWAEVNLKHTWVAFLQTLLRNNIPSEVVKVPGLNWLIFCFYCFQNDWLCYQEDALNLHKGNLQPFGCTWIQPEYSWVTFSIYSRKERVPTSLSLQSKHLRTSTLQGQHLTWGWSSRYITCHKSTSRLGLETQHKHLDYLGLEASEESRWSNLELVS